MADKKISFVIPCYRSEKTLEGVINEIDRTLEKMPGFDYDITLINDGSPDNTWKTIQDIAAGRSDNRVYGINLAIY